MPCLRFGPLSGKSTARVCSARVLIYPWGKFQGLIPTFTEGAAMETDPVCKMPTDPDMAEFKSEYKGKDYYFCSSACYDKFTRDPKDYI